jgi:hypothetical protein
LRQAPQASTHEIVSYTSFKTNTALQPSIHLLLQDSLYMGADRKLLERKKTIICSPDYMPQSEMVSYVTNLLGLNFKAYPEDKKLPADTTISAAMSQKFPCPR